MSTFSRKVQTMALAGMAGMTTLTMGRTADAAAIAVTNTVAGITANEGTADGSGVLFTSASFDASGGNAVALLLTAEGLTDDGAYTGLSATFAGQAMTSVTAVDTKSGTQSATIFYLLNPALTSGTFEVNVGAGVVADYDYSLIALSGVGSVAGTDGVGSSSKSTTTPLELSYTTTTDGGFVLGAGVNNDYSYARKLSVVSGSNPDTDLEPHTVVDSSGHMHVYGDVPTAGSYTDGYLGQYDRTAIVTVAFNAVPEPSTLSLLALGGLSLLMRRRRLV